MLFPEPDGHEGDELARRDRQRDTAEGIHRVLAEPVLLGEVACLEDGGAVGAAGAAGAGGSVTEPV